MYKPLIYGCKLGLIDFVNTSKRSEVGFILTNSCTELTFPYEYR